MTDFPAQAKPKALTWLNRLFPQERNLWPPRLGKPVGTVRRITTAADRTAKSTTCTR
jgi:hypothetical protein